MMKNDLDKVKAYPLIYSRTKHVDYVKGFLARPKDLTAQAVKEAVGYVSSALENVNNIPGVRHSVFSLGDGYVVYDGIACTFSAMLRGLRESGQDALAAQCQDYQKDDSGRILNFFIGFAVKRAEWNKLYPRREKGLVPALTLKTACETYLSYLKKQWKAVSTNTEFSEAVWLPVVPYDGFQPQYEKSEYYHLRFVKNFTETNCQKHLQFYFHRSICHPEDHVSFLSRVSFYDLSENYPFHRVSLAEGSAEEWIAKLEEDSSPHEETPSLFASISPRLELEEKKKPVKNSPSFPWKAAALITAAVLAAALGVWILKIITKPLEEEQLTRTDPLGREITVTFDSSGYLMMKAVAPSGRVTAVTTDSAGNITLKTDWGNETAIVTVDSAGKVTVAGQTLITPSGNAADAGQGRAVTGSARP